MWPPAHPGSRPVDGRVALRLISPCRSDDGSPEAAYRLVLPVQLMDMQPNHFLQRIGSAARGQRNLLALNTMRPRRS